MKIVYGEHCLTPKHGCSPEVILVFLSLQPSWGSVNSSPARVYTVVNKGKRAWLLIWDNASWHYSKIVRTWIREHNQQVKTSGKGVRILPLFLPKQSPWLNPIEPKWVHGKRAVVEPNGLLTAKQLAERICAYYHCSYEAHLSVPEKTS